MPPFEDAVGEVGGAKKEESWLRAMKRVKIDLRARWRSWKGRSGGCVVKVVKKGFMTEVRIGGV